MNPYPPNAGPSPHLSFPVQPQPGGAPGQPAVPIMTDPHLALLQQQGYLQQQQQLAAMSAAAGMGGGAGGQPGMPGVPGQMGPGVVPMGMNPQLLAQMAAARGMNMGQGMHGGQGVPPGVPGGMPTPPVKKKKQGRPPGSARQNQLLQQQQQQLQQQQLQQVTQDQYLKSAMTMPPGVGGPHHAHLAGMPVGMNLSMGPGGMPIGPGGIPIPGVPGSSGGIGIPSLPGNPGVGVGGQGPGAGMGAMGGMGGMPGMGAMPMNNPDAFEPWADAVDELDARELAMARFRARHEIMADLFGPETIKDISISTVDPWEGLGMDGETLEAKVAALESENVELESKAESHVDDFRRRLEQAEQGIAA